MSLVLAEGYAKRHDFLTVLGLPAGTMDPANIKPEQDTALIATVANLVVRTDFHPDLLRLMTIAIVAVHSEGGILEGFREFPNFDHADLPVSPNERACFWGGWGGSLVVNDLDARMTVCYVMNRMGEGTTGDMRGAAIVMSAYGALAG